MKEQTTRTPPKLRVLSAFLAVAMLLTLLPAAAFADDRPGWYYTKDGVKYFNDINSTVWQVYKLRAALRRFLCPKRSTMARGVTIMLAPFSEKPFRITPESPA